MVKCLNIWKISVNRYIGRSLINIAASTANCAEETHNQSKEHEPVSGFETISLITSVGESYF